MPSEPNRTSSLQAATGTSIPSTEYTRVELFVEGLEKIAHPKREGFAAGLDVLPVSRWNGKACTVLYNMAHVSQTIPIKDGLLTKNSSKYLREIWPVPISNLVDIRNKVAFDEKAREQLLVVASNECYTVEESEYTNSEARTRD